METFLLEQIDKISLFKTLVIDLIRANFMSKSGVLECNVIRQ